MPLPIKLQVWAVTSLSLENRWSTPGLLKLQCAPEPTGILLKGRFWVSRPGVGPELLHFFASLQGKLILLDCQPYLEKLGPGSRGKSVNWGVSWPGFWVAFAFIWLPSCLSLQLNSLGPRFVLPYLPHRDVAKTEWVMQLFPKEWTYAPWV